jgi:peptidyl-Lys metalloendopeptidase
METSLYLLKWNSPFDTISGASSFTVQRNGEALPYLGALAKRTKSVAAYKELEPSQEVTVTIDLSNDFDFSEKGTYTVQLNMPSLEILFDGASTLNVEVVSNEISFFLKAHSSLAPVERSSNDTKLGITYQSCTSSQQTTVNNAWNAFITMVNAMNTYMSTNQQTATYTTFFGQTSYWSTVAGIISREKSAAGTGAVRFNCAPPSCGSDDVFAYVYPTDTTKTVYLCGAFWRSKMTGYDSQPGVIVHELSHFNAIGGTKDYAYGVTAAKQLAISSPSKAVANADNYEYYGETVPR